MWEECNDGAYIRSALSASITTGGLTFLFHTYRFSMNTGELMAGMQVPGYAEDVRVRDAIPGQKRAIFSAQDVADSMLTSVTGKRFRGEAVLGPLRAALPDQLARGLRVVNTGFSTTDAQTDQIITQLVFARPFPQRWEQGYVEKSALFANRSEATFGVLGMHTVADVPVLNFLLELGALQSRQQTLVPRAGIVTELDQLAARFGELTATTAAEARDRWNFLGPMTTFQDAGIHSSMEPVRRAQGAERMLGWSVFNRSHTFNLFGTHLKRGDQLYYVCRDYDMSPYQHFVDPHGNAVVARSSYPAQALQVRGFSESSAAFPPPSTYDPKEGPDSFKNPHDGDADYVRRAHKMAAEWKPIKADGDGVPVRDASVTDETVQSIVASIPQVVYNAYMTGTVYRVGIARHTEGRAPTEAQILDAHRSQEKMKLLQTVEIYRGL